MSLVGQVLCQRIVIGPCALATMGKPSAAAPAAAAVRNFLRLTPFEEPALPSFFFTVTFFASIDFLLGCFCGCQHYVARVLGNVSLAPCQDSASFPPKHCAR